MYCRNCGTTNPNGTKYCRKCCSDMAKFGAPDPPPRSSAPEPTYYHGSVYHYNHTGTPYSHRPPYSPYDYHSPYHMHEMEQSENYATAAMVLGIISLMTVFLYIGVILGAVAIVMGVMSKTKGNMSPSATAGIVCGAISCSMFFILIIIAVSSYSYFPYYYYY